VTVRFGAIVALNEVSFDVRRGEILGLIGPNGAGKTTLFNLIAGDFLPYRRTSGSPFHIRLGRSGRAAYYSQASLKPRACGPCPRT
jgi:branched-chain amino acid transport system ATP-binding protein